MNSAANCSKAEGIVMNRIDRKIDDGLDTLPVCVNLLYLPVLPFSWDKLLTTADALCN